MRISVDKNDRSYAASQKLLAGSRKPLIRFEGEPIPFSWLLVTADEDAGMIKYTEIDPYGVLITDGFGYAKIKTAYGVVRINFSGRAQP